MAKKKRGKSRCKRKIRYAKKGFILLETPNGLLAINNKGSYEHHSHVANYDTGVYLINLVIKKKLPNDSYVCESARRITIDKIYENRLLERVKEIDNNKRRNELATNESIELEDGRT